MITSILTLAATMQAAAGEPASYRPETFETLSLEYPYAIAPYIDDYYNCLKSRDVIMGQGRTFESEHQSAISQCADARSQAFEDASDRLERRARKDMSAEQLANVFEKIQIIHVQRGRNMDAQMGRRAVENPRNRGDLQTTSSVEAAPEPAPQNDAAVESDTITQ